MTKKYLDLTGFTNFAGKVKDALSNKVDAVEGMGLSQNSYTDSEKEQVANAATELADARIGWDETEYASAGEAIREQSKGAFNVGTVAKEEAIVALEGLKETGALKYSGQLVDVDLVYKCDFECNMTITMLYENILYTNNKKFNSRVLVKQITNLLHSDGSPLNGTIYVKTLKTDGTVVDKGEYEATDGTLILNFDLDIGELIFVGFPVGMSFKYYKHSSSIYQEIRESTIFKSPVLLQFNIVYQMYTYVPTEIANYFYNANSLSSTVTASSYYSAFTGLEHFYEPYEQITEKKYISGLLVNMINDVFEIVIIKNDQLVYEFHNVQCHDKVIRFVYPLLLDENTHILLCPHQVEADPGIRYIHLDEATKCEYRTVPREVIKTTVALDIQYIYYNCDNIGEEFVYDGSRDYILDKGHIEKLSASEVGSSTRQYYGFNNIYYQPYEMLNKDVYVHGLYFADDCGVSMADLIICEDDHINKKFTNVKVIDNTIQFGAPILLKSTEYILVKCTESDNEKFCCGNNGSDNLSWHEYIEGAESVIASPISLYIQYIYSEYDYIGEEYLYNSLYNYTLENAFIEQLKTSVENKSQEYYGINNRYYEPLAIFDNDIYIHGLQSKDYENATVNLMICEGSTIKKQFEDVKLINHVVHFGCPILLKSTEYILVCFTETDTEKFAAHNNGADNKNWHECVAGEAPRPSQISLSVQYIYSEHNYIGEEANRIEQESVESSKPSFTLTNKRLPSCSRTDEPVFVGKWFDYKVGDTTYTATNTDGAMILVYCQGISSIDVVFKSFSNVSYTQYYSYGIDSMDMTRSLITSTTIDLPDTDGHFVIIMVDGMGERDGGYKGSNQIGLYLESITAGLGGFKPKKTIVFLGDSITEGINALGTGANSNVNSASNSYTWNTCKKLKTMPIFMGYGASGITTDGSFFKAVNAMRYNYTGSPTKIFDPDLIVCNHGTNDNSLVNNGTYTAEQFDEKYVEFIDVCSSYFPGVPLILVSPFNNGLNARIANIASSNNVYYVNGGAFTDRLTTDGTHLSAEGAVNIGNQLADAILDIVGEEFFI